jgi:hypothetical protein
MIWEDEKRAVRALIMHIDICLPVVLLSVRAAMTLPSGLRAYLVQSFLEITLQMIE